jgi:hypothetical protein
MPIHSLCTDRNADGQRKRPRDVLQEGGRIQRTCPSIQSPHPHNLVKNLRREKTILSHKVQEQAQLQSQSLEVHEEMERYKAETRELTIAATHAKYTIVSTFSPCIHAWLVVHMVCYPANLVSH